VIYLKWKLSDGTSGTSPSVTFTERGGHITPSEYVDETGYRVGYMTVEIDDLSGLEEWDVTEITEAEALAWAQQFHPDAFIKTADQGSTGFISSYWCESNPFSPIGSPDFVDAYNNGPWSGYEEAAE
jgi:hypothetical protein